jgi:hypothetical protein
MIGERIDRSMSHIHCRDVYVGDFQGGIQHGIGLLIGHDGTRYIGQWAGGKREGYVIEIISSAHRGLMQVGSMQIGCLGAG